MKRKENKELEPLKESEVYHFGEQKVGVFYHYS